MWIDVIVSKSKIVKMSIIIFKPFQVNVGAKRTSFVFESFGKSSLIIFNKDETVDWIILHSTAEILSDIDVRGLFQDLRKLKFLSKGHRMDDSRLVRSVCIQAKSASLTGHFGGIGSGARVNVSAHNAG